MNNDITGNILVNNMNKEMPQVKADAKEIVKLVKSGGAVVGYVLNDGIQITREQGVDLAKDGMIKNVAIAENKGTEYLRSLPDGDEANNLSSLPSITDSNMEN